LSDHRDAGHAAHETGAFPTAIEHSGVSGTNRSEPPVKLLSVLEHFVKRPFPTK
jgi:hypothetical protein